MPEAHLAATVSVASTSLQVTQGIGYLVGSAMLAFGATMLAPLIAASLLLVSAVVYAGLAVPGGTASTRVLAGLRLVASHLRVRLVLILVAIHTTVSALPETLAAAVTSGAWLPLVLAANNLGGAVGMAAAVRRRSLTRPSGQVTTIALGAAALAVGVAAHSPGVFVLVNVAAGLSLGWVVGGHLVVLHLVPKGRAATAGGLIAAIALAVEGVAAAAWGRLAETAGVNAAYLAGGTLVLALLALTLPLARRAAASSDRPDEVIDLSARLAGHVATS